MNDTQTSIPPELLAAPVVAPVAAAVAATAVVPVAAPAPTLTVTPVAAPAVTTSVAPPVAAPVSATSAPIPLTAAVGSTTDAAMAPRVKRKYTRRAQKEADAPKRRGRPPKNKTPEDSKGATRAKRSAGVKFQGQGPKSLMRAFKHAAKEKDFTISKLVGEAVKFYGERKLGWDPDA